MMLPEMENRIRAIFHVEEFLSTGYTSNETGAIGFKCPHLPASHFHIHENMQHLSLSPLHAAPEQDQQQVRGGDAAALQGQQQQQEREAPPPDLTSPPVAAATVMDGETGKIVATNLNRTLMPLVRYEIGDMGQFIPRSIATNVNVTSSGTDAGAGAGSCGCGRRLRVLRLLGRCDCRIRLGAEDLLYLEEIPRCLQAANHTIATATAPEHAHGLPSCLLSLSVGCFSLEVTKSPRQFDHVTLHVEATSEAGWERQRRHTAEGRRVRGAVVQALGRHTQLMWEVKREEEGGDDVMFVHMMAKKRKLSEALIEQPKVVVHSPGALPRNPRTGKIVLLEDRRC